MWVVTYIDDTGITCHAHFPQYQQAVSFAQHCNVVIEITFQ